MTRSTLAALLLFLLLSLKSLVIQADLLIQPTPTPTTPFLFVASNDISISKPTNAPAAIRLAKRDNVQATLSLYKDWAAVCNGNADFEEIDTKGVDANLRQLWQTVTETVYCGNNRVKTVTKTITTTATATETVSSDNDDDDDGTSCDSQCWSDYLWHTYGYGISVAQGFTGIVCILIGVYFMLFGYRFFRPTLALTGFVFFAFMTWIGLVNNEPPGGFPNNEITYICVSVGLGLLGAALFMFFYPVGLYGVGTMGGFFLSIYIMSWRANLVIQLKVARICFIIGMGVLFAFLVFLLESYIIVFSTSLMGAYLFFLGLDFFVHTGFVNAVLLIFDGNQYHYNAYIMNTPVYVMLSFVAFLTIVSFGWQYYWNIYKNKRYFGINVVKEEAAPPEKA
ncbi:hypothetical protein VTP01DRAFT_398 [Rhizomucor pusillus]|uniref:uncharacterized protein n=1 Tax=Rhizomucor pusillus TaxID=4840 RepID=UPI003742EF28